MIMKLRRLPRPAATLMVAALAAMALTVTLAPASQAAARYGAAASTVISTDGIQGSGAHPDGIQGTGVHPDGIQGSGAHPDGIEGTG